MADFATVFGIRIPTTRNDWRQTPIIVGGGDDRVDSGVLGSGETTRKREWGTSLITGTQVEREAMRRLLEGDGLAVDFDDATGFSWSGLGPSLATGVTYSASGGKRGGRAILASAGALEYSLAQVMRQPDGAWSATRGWTIAVHKKLSVGDGGDGTTFHDHLATGSVAVVRGASANPAGVTQYRGGVAGSWAMGNWLAVTAGGVAGVYGYSNANVATAYDYDELVVLPWALPPAMMATWAANLATFRASYSVGRLPRVLLAGECIPDPAPLEVRWRQVRSDLDQMAFEGAWNKTSTKDEYSVRQV